MKSQWKWNIYIYPQLSETQYSKNPLTRTYILPNQPGIGSYILICSYMYKFLISAWGSYSGRFLLAGFYCTPYLYVAVIQLLYICMWFKINLSFMSAYFFRDVPKTSNVYKYKSANDFTEWSAIVNRQYYWHKCTLKCIPWIISSSQ